MSNKGRTHVHSKREVLNPVWPDCTILECQVAKLVTKVAQIFCDFFGYFYKCHFLNKTNVCTFWTTFDKY